jgi:predicted GNAT family N-acyltransferase
MSKRFVVADLPLVGGDHHLLKKVFELRYEVYVREQGKVIDGADHMSAQVREEADQNALHQLCALDGVDNVVGAVRINSTPDVSQLDSLQWFKLIGGTSGGDGCFISRFVVRSQFRSTGCARALIRLAASCCFQRSIDLVVIRCRSSYVRFYEGLGFQVYAAPFSD